MVLKSVALEEGGNTPSEHICDGKYVSPELSWYNSPKGTKSFALSIADPDAPSGEWIRWLVYEIPKEVKHLEKESLLLEARRTVDDFDKKECGGPCPPK